MKRLIAVLMFLFSISAMAQAAHQAALTWTPATQPTGVTVSGFNVYRSQTSGSYGTTPLGTTAATVNNFNDTTVVGGQTYFYVVTTLCATCTTKESKASNEFKAVIPPDTVPNPPVLNGTVQ